MDPGKDGGYNRRKPQGHENQQQLSACAPSCVETKDHNKRDKEQGQLLAPQID